MADGASLDERSTAQVAAQLADLLLGYQRTQLLRVAAELRLADLLADGPRPVTDLAEETGTHAPSLYRVLRALAGDGVFAERDDGTFQLTPMAEALRSGVPGSLRNMVLAHGQDIYPVWSELLYSVRTGRPAFEHVHGMSNWAYRAQHPDANARFNAYMGDRARLRTAEVARSSFPEHGVVVDVGGGDGTLLAAILAANPGLTGVLFDQPHVVVAAGPVLQAAGVADRCEVVGGNFFEGVPEGGDVYVLSAVLHDWDDDRSVEILEACRGAMKPDGTVLVVEQVMPPGNTKSSAKLVDILMLVMNEGGRERTEVEWRNVLRRAGLELGAIVLTTSGYCTLEARRIDPAGATGDARITAAAP